MHYDVEWAKRHGQVLAFTAPGATLFPQVIGEVFIAFAGLSCDFLREVHAGDTLYPELKIIGLEPGIETGVVTTAATVHNQRGELVLSGEHRYLLRLAAVVVATHRRADAAASVLLRQRAPRPGLLLPVPS